MISPCVAACVDHLTVDSKVKHSKSPPSYLDPILLKSNKEVLVTSMNPEGPDGNMLLVAVSTDVNERRMKVRQFIVFWNPPF